MDNNVPVAQYDREGTLIRTYGGVYDVELCKDILPKKLQGTREPVTVSGSCVSRSSRKPYSLGRNFQWRRYNIGEDPLPSIGKWIPKNNSDSGYEGHRIRPVAQYDLKGKFIKHFDSLKDAKEELGISTAMFKKAIDNGSTIYGYYWRDHDFENTVLKIKPKNYVQLLCQYELDGSFKEWYPGVKYAATELKFGRNSLYAAILRNNGVFINYQWRLVDDVDQIVYEIDPITSNTIESSKGIGVIRENINTKVERFYLSISKCSKDNSISHPALTKLLDSNVVIDNHMYFSIK